MVKQQGHCSIYLFISFTVERQSYNIRTGNRRTVISEKITLSLLCETNHALATRHLGSARHGPRVSCLFSEI